MKKERIIMNKVILNKFLLLCLFLISINVYTQERNIDSLINNDNLKFKLFTDKNMVLLEVENTTCDTVYLRTIVAVENPLSLCHIIGFEKCYKKEEKKDSIFYKRGFLLDYSEKLNGINYMKLPKKLSRIPPKTKIKEDFIQLKHSGEYYFKIQTFYVHNKKTYFIRTETNKIKID